MPIDSFGDAMLRGMGASEAQLSERVPDHMLQRRQMPGEFAGLGATVHTDFVDPKKLRRKQRMEAQRARRMAEELEAAGGPALRTGSVVRVLAGGNKGRLALVVDDLDERAGRAANGASGSIRVRVGAGDGGVVSLSRLSLRGLSSLAELSRAEAEGVRELQRHEARQRRRAARGDRSDGVGGSDRRGDRRGDGQHERRRRDRDRDGQQDQSRRDDGKRRAWLHAGILVRVVDERWRSGRFQHRKGHVVDVTSPGVGTVQLETGRSGQAAALLEEVPQSALQTRLPSSAAVQEGGDASRVRVLRGKWRGSLGRLVRRDKAADELLVLLEEEGGRTTTLSADDAAAIVHGR